MDKTVEMLEEVIGAVENEFSDFRISKIIKDADSVFMDEHEIDIKSHLRDFFADESGDYLSEYEIKCLLKIRGSILDDLYSFIVDGLDAMPYATYDNCSDIVTDFVAQRF